MGQEDTGTKEAKQGGEEDVEMGEGGEEAVGKGTKTKKGKTSRKGKERATEETEGGEEEGDMAEKTGEGVGTGMKEKKAKKGKERATEKEGKKGSEGSEGSEGEEMREMKRVGASATTDAMDTVCNDAIIGYCRLNLFKPPAPLRFGLYNKRELMESQAKKFAMTMGAVRPFARGNMLPIVIAKEDVEEECYRLIPNVEKAPFLKLKPGVAERKGYQLKFAGGRHRYRAMELLVQKSKDTLKDLQSKITETDKKMKEEKTGENKREALEKKKEELQEQQRAERGVENMLSVWGVVLYEESE